MNRSSSLKKSGNYSEIDPESGYSLNSGGNLGRKKSLIRTERARLDNPDHPNYYYNQVVNQEIDHISVQPSNSGLDPSISNQTDIYRSN
ncbi:uncharacterized protein ASCRUDRAFT_38914, partial [Ascoidea rubescens DSM 1968]